jgi:hypothetical protein
MCFVPVAKGIAWSKARPAPLNVCLGIASERGNHRLYPTVGVPLLCQVVSCKPQFRRPWSRDATSTSFSTAWAYDTSERWLLTNHHCVQDAVVVNVRSISFMNKPRKMPMVYDDGACVCMGR